MNWQQFFEDNHIEYVTRSPNLSRDWLGLRCPWCGDDDPSQHLGCHPSGSWSCWRDSTHKGAKPDYLISALLGVTKAQGRLLALAYGASTPDQFDAPAAPVGASQGNPPAAIVDLAQFMPIQHGKLTHKFWEYLKNRGFDDPDAVIHKYNLKASLSGRWSGRLIIPVNDVGWQGRALRTTKDTPRYLTSHEEVKKTLFNIHQRGEILYVCEGPFDALKIDFYGQEHGARATCLFGASPTIEQLHLLSLISKDYKRVVLLLDNDGAGQAAAFQLSDWIRNVVIGSLLDGASDPGSMSGEQVRRMINET